MKRLLVCLAISVGLSGCSHTALPFEKADSLSQVFVTTIDLMNTVVIDSLDVEKGMVTLKNLLPKEQDIKYRFTWYDNQGLELFVSQYTWTHATLPRLGVKTIESQNKPKNGAYFRLQLSQ